MTGEPRGATQTGWRFSCKTDPPADVSPCFNRLRYAFPLQPVNTPPCFPYVIIQCFSAHLPGEVQREAVRPATAETSPGQRRREAETSKSSLAALLLQEALHD